MATPFHCLIPVSGRDLPSFWSENSAQQLTRGGGYAAVESEDGRTVYFSREMMASGLWSVPADGGEETRIGDFKVNQCCMYALCRDGVYYAATENPEQSFELWFYRFSSGRSEHIRRVKMRLESGMSLSPEGRYLLFTAAREGTSDLMMIENFR
jgi:Tol biopolymer transport system component